MGTQSGFKSNRDKRDQKPSFQGPSEIELHEIFLGNNVTLLVTWADRIGRWLAEQDHLTTNQLRNVFGTVRQIQMRWKKGNETSAWNEIVLLRPKMAYFAKRAAEAKGKEKSEGLKTLQKVIEPGIILLDQNRPQPPSDEAFQRFVDFFEGIVAYHTRYARK
jgi:CRISPR-associated protein Csm2